MKHTLLYSLALLLILGLAGCQDLSVENANNPDRTLALARPGDVEALIAETFTDYWTASQWCSAGALFLSTIADENSSAWANWGMRDMSSEPRIAWDNGSTYNRRSSTENPWFRGYRGISNASDGLQAIARAEAEGSVEDNVYTREGFNTDRLKAFAKLNQGLIHGWLALMFDQAFIVDETVDLENDVLSLSPYQDVMQAALGFLDEARAIAQNNIGDDSFTITADEDWIFSVEVDAELMVKLANSFAARFMVQLPRDEAARAAVNWGEVVNRIDNGITEDFVPIGDDSGSINETDCLKRYGQNGTTWSRADYRTIGPADESVCDPGDDKINCYQEWIDTPLQDRLVFDIFTTDRRIVGDASDLTVDGTDFQYQGNNGPFPAARGTYHYSSHNHKRYQEFFNNSQNGPMPNMLVAEMDMYRAEALLRTGGSTDEVAALINKTRVARGQLNPASGSDPVGSSTDGHSHLDNVSLWAKMKYERRIETFQTAAGLAYFDKRGLGDLVTGTPIHFPIPGKELETLALQNYTFGGVGGPGSAPKWLQETAYEEYHPRVK